MLERLELEFMDDGPAWGISFLTGKLGSTSRTVRIVAHITNENGAHEVRTLGTFLRPHDAPLPIQNGRACDPSGGGCDVLVSTHLNRVRAALTDQGWAETSESTCCRIRASFERTAPEPH